MMLLPKLWGLDHTLGPVAGASHPANPLTANLAEELVVPFYR